MSKVSIVHYNQPGFDFDQFLAFSADAGAGFVELNINDVGDTDSADDLEAKAAEVRKQVASHGLRVSALSSANDFVVTDPDAIAYQVDRMKRIAGLTRILDEEAVVRTEGGYPKDEVAPAQYEDAMYECFSRCVGFVDEMKVGLAVDNHGLVTNDGDLLISLLNRIDHPLIGSNLDTMNFRWFGNSIEDCNRFYETLAPRVLHVHFKDGFDGRENYRGAALGEGEIDLQSALASLRKAGYNGAYAAEYEGPELEEALGYRKCLQWLNANV